MADSPDDSLCCSSCYQLLVTWSAPVFHCRSGSSTINASMRSKLECVGSHSPVELYVHHRMTDTQKFEITNCMYSRAQIKANKQRIFSNLTHNKNRHSCVHWIADVARQRLQRILTPKLSPVSKQVSGVSSTERKRRVQLVFAYPFHFIKSGFSAYFSRQIRISGFYPDFLCRSLWPL